MVGGGEGGGKREAKSKMDKITLGFTTGFRATVRLRFKNNTHSFYVISQKVFVVSVFRPGRVGRDINLRTIFFQKDSSTNVIRTPV